jgi:hypothetical protein
VSRREEIRMSAAEARSVLEEQRTVTRATFGAPQRVALPFRERHRMTWDHRKLGGTY